MNLTIDAGNTSIKVMVFKDNVAVYRNENKKLSVRFLKNIFLKYSIQHSILSSVIQVDPAVIKFMKQKGAFLLFTLKTPIPVKNKYRTPHTLGQDRLSSAIAAHSLFPKRNVLVIDVGTCIKYDFVNDKGQYCGGSISPGLNMRFKALNSFTEKLPLVRFGPVKKLTGDATETSIQTGVEIGMEEEIKGFITRYKKQYKRVKVVITGGDASRFVSKLNLSIFAASDLVNLGLNEIIKYNVQK